MVMGCFSNNEEQELLPGSSNSEGAGTNGQTCLGTMRHLAGRICAALKTRYFWKALLLGQFISIILCGTAVTSGLLSNQKVDIPTAQSFLNYVLLCLVFTPILACRLGQKNLCVRLKSWGWKYVLIAIADVEANFLVVSAYQYTTVTSVQLLDSFSIPMVLVLSCLILRVRYRLIHYIGIIICIVGMVGLVLTDLLSGNATVKDTGNAPNQALGDILVIAGAALYGVSNVAQEYVVKLHDKTEFLGMVGLFGSFINGIQFAILERDNIMDVDFGSYKIFLPVIGFTICQFLLYTCMTVVIQQTSATNINISLQSADFYTLLFGLFLFKYEFHILYFVSFVLTIFGIAVYSCQATETNQDSDSHNRNLNPKDTLGEISESSVDE